MSDIAPHVFGGTYVITEPTIDSDISAGDRRRPGLTVNHTTGEKRLVADGDVAQILSVVACVASVEGPLATVVLAKA